MIPTSPALLVEELSAARALFQEAVRTDAFIVGSYEKALDAQLLAVGSSPTQASLLTWARSFRGACIGASPLLSGQPMPTDERLEVSALAEALERELQGDLRGAVVVLGGMLVHQGRLEASEVGEVNRGPEPGREELRTVLGTWIQRGAAWGGPILGWIRDLHHRLEAPGDEKEGGEPR